MATFADLQLEYEGSVKNVFEHPGQPDFLWFQFTDDYSVFDWGKMPDRIANKGKSLTLLGAHIFNELSQANFWKNLPNSPHLKKFRAEYLAQRWQHLSFSGGRGLSQLGLQSHFVALVDTYQNDLALSAKSLPDYARQDLLLKVLRAQVNWPIPKTLFGQSIYFYDLDPVSSPRRSLIPLEIVFRFGMSKGSSLVKRLQTIPGYAQQLGFPTPPTLDEWFDHPVIEFFSKLEPKDRFLSWQEASVLSGLNADLFEELIEIALSTALGLHHLFAEKGLELWDGKLEFVLEVGQENKLLLADSVGPDELRLIYRGQQMSKELIRQFYRSSSWVNALQKAQELASESPDRDWKEICTKDLKEAPSPLPPPVKEMVNHLYGVLANHIIGQTVFFGEPTLDELADLLDSTLFSVDRKN